MNESILLAVYFTRNSKEACLIKYKNATTCMVKLSFDYLLLSSTENLDMPFADKSLRSLLTNINQAISLCPTVLTSLSNPFIGREFYVW